jgi:hypothetical protein
MIDEGEDLPTRRWMPSRIPVRDALVANFGAGVQVPADRLPKAHELRWYPEPNGELTLRVPYDGSPYDDSLFAIERAAWDHTTCDNCTAHIPAMTLCYVTASGAYVGLCVSCYRTLVVAKIALSRRVLWHLRRLFRAHSAA